MENPRCPETGTPMERGSQVVTFTYKDRSLDVGMPGWYCPECGEGIYTGSDMRVSDRALNRLKAESEGLLTPEQVKKIRKKLNLTQVEAGTLIGGGPKAFQKYESGDLLLSRGIHSALVLLESEPESLNLLRERVAVHQNKPSEAMTAEVVENEGSIVVAKNTGRDHRIGAVKGRSQSVNPKTGMSTKRDMATGRFLDVKTTGGPFKGVRKEK